MPRTEIIVVKGRSGVISWTTGFVSSPLNRILHKMGGLQETATVAEANGDFNTAAECRKKIRALEIELRRKSRCPAA